MADKQPTPVTITLTMEEIEDILECLDFIRKNSQSQVFSQTLSHIMVKLEHAYHVADVQRLFGGVPGGTIPQGVMKAYDDTNADKP